MQVQTCVLLTALLAAGASFAHLAAAQAGSAGATSEQPAASAPDPTPACITKLPGSEKVASITYADTTDKKGNEVPLKKPVVIATIRNDCGVCVRVSLTFSRCKPAILTTENYVMKPGGTKSDAGDLIPRCLATSTHYVSNVDACRVSDLEDME